MESPRPLVPDLVLPEAELTEDDRSHLIAELRTAVGNDTLTLDEFAERAGLVYAATSREACTHACDGIDVSWPLSWISPSTPAVQARAPRSARPSPTGTVVSVFGSNSRKGRWRTSDNVLCVSVFGNVTLDFRNATFDADCERIRIRTLALFGSVSVSLPPGVDGTMTGASIFGSKVLKIAPVPAAPGTPLVEMKVASLFGSVSLRSKGDGLAERVRRAFTSGDRDDRRPERLSDGGRGDRAERAGRDSRRRSNDG